MTNPDRGNVTVNDEHLAARFAAHRLHLRAVAYRMLGSLSEADDAVQEAWLHLRRADTTGVDNLAGWLTTVVARVCLDLLRVRRSRREQPLGLPDPVLGSDPEQSALLAESVGLAMLVVLDTLGPAERVAFVLHDIFALPFDEIAPIVGRTPAAARKLASRARRRMASSGATEPDRDPTRQWAAVDGFLAAARDGDLAALVAVLDPDVVLHGDTGTGIRTVRGAGPVAEQAMAFSARVPFAQPVPVNGAAGLVVVAHDRPVAVLAFTVRGTRIVELDILADPTRLSRVSVPPPAGRSASPGRGRSPASPAAGPGYRSPRPPR
jgi:RNA polymerase sigma-70 factor, ECF subfamily